MEQNKKIKLLVITPTLQCGGSEKYVAMLCNHINTQKFDVTLVVLDNADAFYSINSTVVDLKIKHVRSSILKLRTVIRTYTPDIVFSTANHLNIYLAFFRRIFPPKMILIARESSVVSINSKRAKFGVLYNWLIKKYYKRLNHIICQSQYMQQDLISNYGIAKEQTTVINNAVKENEQTSPSNENNILITVSRLSEEKGIDRLIRAVAQLSVPFSFYIIGDGDKRNELQSLINQLQLQDKVFLEGQKQNPFSGREEARLFLMGSYYEGFPNSLLEAGALGIPVVAFDVPGGINEIITDGENGLLVKGSNEKLFAAAIEHALTIPFNRQQIKTNTLQKFSTGNIVKKIEDLLATIYQQHHPPC